MRKKINANQGEVLVQLLNNNVIENAMLAMFEISRLNRNTLRSLHKRGFIEYKDTTIKVGKATVKRIVLTKIGREACYKYLDF